MLESCKAQGQVPLPSRQVWQQVKDLRRPWHPLVATEHWQLGPHGQAQLRFTTADHSEYVEQQTFLSHSQQTLAYKMLNGIDGIDQYHAWLTLGENDPKSTDITWQAFVDGPDHIAKVVVQGSKVILQQGILALSHLDPKAQKPAPQAKACALSPAVITEQYLSGSPSLAIRTSGTHLASDTVMVFLHGIGGQANNWDEQLSLMGHTLPCAAIDLRGYGNSELGDNPTRIEDYIADILRVKQYFGAKKLVICGLSYGAWIAASFATKHPDLLQALVVSGGCTGMSEASAQERSAFLAARQVPLSQGLTPADFAEPVVQMISGPDASKKQRQRLHTSMAAISSATYADALQCFCKPPGPLDFQQLTCPVLLMTGDQDTLAPPAEITDLAKRLHTYCLAEQGPAWVQLEILQNCGHVCNILQADQYNDYLETFVNRCTGLSATGVEANVTTGPSSPKLLKRQQKHTKIIGAALAEFAEQGYSGTSLDQIAKRAGVSKPTLYQYIGNKEALFQAVLSGSKQELLQPLTDGSNADMISALWDFSWHYAQFVLRPDMLSLARLIIGEAQRLPDIAASYQQEGPHLARQGIIDYLSAQASKGLLDIQDTVMAAESLWSLILSASREHLLHYALEKPDAEQIERHIRHGLSVFIKVFSTQIDHHLQQLQQQVVPNNPF